MHLTQPTTTYSVFSRGGGFSSDAPGIREALRHGGGLQGVLVFASLAEGIRLPLLRPQDALEDGQRAISLQNVPLPGLRYRGDHLPGLEAATGGLVSRYVVHHQPEDRNQRFGSAAGTGAGKLQDGLGHAA